MKAAPSDTQGNPGRRVDRLALNPDRYFDPEPTVRRLAGTIYERTRDLPLICPHGHVDPQLLAENVPFAEPTSLIITRDHYIFRMLYSRGIAMEALGIPRRDGTPVETDPRRAWQLFADNYYLFRGTPTGCWLDQEFAEVFGVTRRLGGQTAMLVYDEINEKLSSPEFLPRALFDRFNIEVLVTTDSAASTLAHHKAIRESGWGGTVLPTFRPDSIFRIAAPNWTQEIHALGAVSGAPIDGLSSLLRALEDRRAFFKTFGATSTDHGVVQPHTELLTPDEAERLFQRAVRGEATLADQQRFEAHMLMEMARMSVADGLVMQLHPGSHRDHNRAVFDRFGPDTGGDIPVATEYTGNLHGLLNAFGNDPRFRIVLFTLDEATYTRELAPLAGHYPAVRLGPPWWFNDSIEGMTRFRHRVTETAGIYNTAGFNDDTRAFCSIPARHDLARRVDANFLAGLVARHIVEIDDAHEMARALAYDLVKDTYRLTTKPRAAR